MSTPADSTRRPRRTTHNPTGGDAVEQARPVAVNHFAVDPVRLSRVASFIDGPEARAISGRQPGAVL
jgi:hypothetical protein